MQEPSNRIGEGVGQVSDRCHFPIGLNGCRGRFLAGRFALGSVRVVACALLPSRGWSTLPELVRRWRATSFGGRCPPLAAAKGTNEEQSYRPYRAS